MISISEPFIRRPVGTTLLSIGLFLLGLVAYEFLPVAPVPNVDFPSIRVQATRPGADPSVMAATVAAPPGAQARPDRGHRPDHLDEFARHHQYPAHVLHRPRHRPRGARRASRDQCLAVRSAERPADLAEIPEVQFRRSTRLRAGADLQDPDHGRDLRRRRHRDRPAHRSGPGRGRRHRLWRRPARGARLPQSRRTVQRGDRDRRRAACARQRQSARTGRHLQRQPAERDACAQQADAHRGRVPQHHDQERRRQLRPALRRGRRRGLRPQQPLDRLVQQAAGGADPDHQAGRCQRDRDRRSREGADPRSEAMDSGGGRDIDPGRPHHHHPRQRAGHAVDAACDRSAGHDRSIRLLAPADTDCRRRHIGAAGARRHLRRDVARGLLDRQSLADGARDLRRIRGRRRHRHDREHVPQSRTWHGAAARRDGRRAPDRLHRGLDQPVADRGVHAADLHGRHRRSSLARILADPDLRHRGVDRGVADDYADDLRALHQGGDVGSRDPARPGHRGLAVAHRRVLYLDVASRAALSAAYAAGVLRHHRADGDALHQDAEGVFPDRRFRLHHRLDAGLSRHLVPVDADPAAAYGRYRDGRSSGGRSRLGAGRRRRPAAAVRTAAPCSSA